MPTSMLKNAVRIYPGLQSDNSLKQTGHTDVRPAHTHVLCEVDSRRRIDV